MPTFNVLAAISLPFFLSHDAIHLGPKILDELAGIVELVRTTGVILDRKSVV